VIKKLSTDKKECIWMTKIPSLIVIIILKILTLPELEILNKRMIKVYLVCTGTLKKGTSEIKLGKSNFFLKLKFIRIPQI